VIIDIGISVMSTKKPTNAKTVRVEINGQQEDMIRKFAEIDPEGRSIEEIIRQGFAEFAKTKRLSH
jgi:hypothetical protein